MINKIILIGNLTKQPEMKEAGKSSVCSFSVASNNPFSKDEVLFIEVNFWNKTGENCMKYLRKGSQVYIDGRLKMNQWKDPKGNYHQKYFIIGENVRFLKGNIEESSPPSNISKKKQPAAAEEIVDEFEEVPF